MEKKEKGKGIPVCIWNLGPEFQGLCGAGIKEKILKRGWDVDKTYTTLEELGRVVQKEEKDPAQLQQEEEKEEKD